MFYDLKPKTIAKNTVIKMQTEDFLVNNTFKNLKCWIVISMKQSFYCSKPQKKIQNSQKFKNQLTKKLLR